MADPSDPNDPNEALEPWPGSADAGNRETALVTTKPERLELAYSLKDAKPGQLVMLDKEGNVMSKRRRLGVAVTGGLVGGLVGGLASTIGALSVAFPLVAVGGLGFVVFNRRRWAPYRKAVAHLRAHRLNDARLELEKMKTRRPFGGAAFIDKELGRVAWLSGRHTDALNHLDSALTRVRDARSHKKRAMYWLILMTKGAVLAVSEKFASAENVLNELGDSPNGEFFIRRKQFIRLRIAFGQGTPGDMDNEEPYDWAKEALATNLYGATLALLAWHFSVTDDEEMAMHLLSESPPRLGGFNIAKSDPKLAEFIVEAWERWNLAEEHGPLELPR